MQRTGSAAGRKHLGRAQNIAQVGSSTTWAIADGGARSAAGRRVLAGAAVIGAALALVALMAAFAPRWNALAADSELAPLSDTTDQIGDELDPSKPRNTVMLVLDGLDEHMLTAARNYEVGADGRFLMDELPFRGTMTAHGLLPGSGPDYGINHVNDSAATASAWATGQKTIEGRISQGPSTSLGTPGEDLETVMLEHKADGKLVANITDVDVTDATPAAMGSSINNRSCQGPQDMGSCSAARKQNGGKGSIAEQMVDNGVDVILGGGRGRYTQSIDAGGTALDYAVDDLGYQDVGDGSTATRQDLEAIDSLDDGPVLGLFASGYMTPKYSPLVAGTSGAGGSTYRCNESNRGDQPTLAEMTAKGLELVDNPDGFFMQVESAMTDKRAHDSDVCGSLGQVAEADDALEQILAFQEDNPDTLVVVTSDHGHATQIVRPGEARRYATLETADGSPMSVGYSSSTGTGQWHTGTSVPIMAKGPQAANVSGTMDQTDLYEVLEGFPPGSCVHPASDDFDGTSLDAKWTVLREDTGLYEVAGGSLDSSFDGTDSDMTATEQSSTNVFLQPAPTDGPWSATTEMDMSDAKEQSNQAGLMLWQSEGPPADARNYAKVTANARTTDAGAPSQPSWWVERLQTVDGSSSGLGNGNGGYIEGLMPDTVHLRVTSSGGDVQTIRTFYSTDGSEWTQFLDPFQIDTTSSPLHVGLGLHKGANNPDGGVGFVSFAVCDESLDERAPTTTHELDPEPTGEAGWHSTSGPVEVSLSADDGPEGSGVEDTQYRLDGGEWTDYEGPFEVSGPGITLVEYRSTDSAGNAEEPRSVEVKIDDAAPQTSAELDPDNPGEGETYDEPVTVALQAEDGAQGSGVARIAYQVTTNGNSSGWIERQNAGGDEPFGAEHTVSMDGDHVVEFRAVDVAGNEEEVGSIEFATEGLGGLPPCLPESDEFDGTELDSSWDIVRPGPAGTLTVADGSLRAQTLQGDYSGGTSTAQNVLLRDAPEGPWTMTTRIDVTDLVESNHQAGLVAWREEAPNNLAKVVFNRRTSDGEWWVERLNAVDGSSGGQGNGNTGNQPAGPEEIYIRIASDGTSPNPTLRGYWSLDAQSWNAIQDPFQLGGSGQIRIGLGAWSVSGTGSENAGYFDWVRVHAGDDAEGTVECGLPDACLSQSDEFDGASLAGKWDVLRPTGDVQVVDGEVQIPINDGDLIANDPLAGDVLLQDAPDGEWTVTTSLDTSGLDVTGKQAGLVIWQSEDPNTFSKIVAIQSGSNQRFEHIVTQDGSVDPPISESITSAPGGVLPEEALIRARYDGSEVVAEFSADGGETWILVGDEGHAAPFEGEMRIGLTAFYSGPEGGNFGRFGWFRVREGSAEDGPIDCGVEDSCLASGSDLFEGAGVDAKWSIIREDADRYSVAGGSLNLEYAGADGDMTSSTQTSTNLFVQPAPTSGPWSATTEMDLSNAKEQSNQAGLMLWQSEGPPSSENTFAKITANARTDDSSAPSQPSWWVERLAVVEGSQSGLGNGNAGYIEGLIPDTVHLRMTSSGGDTQMIRTHYSTDGIEWTEFLDPFDIPAGSDPLQIGVGIHRGANNPGGIVGFEGFVVCEHALDGAAPATSHELDPAPDGAEGWHVSAPVEVSLAADDNPGGSGIATTEYRIDGGDWNEYAEPFDVGAAGVTLVEYRSTDNAGNVEGIRSVEVLIDEEAPETTAVLEPEAPGPGGTYEDPVTVVLEAEDGSEGSGVASTEHRVITDGDAGDWTESENGDGDEPFEVEIPIAEEGEHTVEFRSTDVASNEEETQDIAFDYAGPPDNTPPVIDEIAADPDTGDAPLDVDFSVEASDADGDDLSYSWDFDDGNSSNEQNPSHTYTDPGTYEAEVTVSDGTDEVSDSVTVQVNDPGGDDLTPPETEHLLVPPAPGDGGTYEVPVTIAFFATDSGPNASGVDYTEYNVNGDGWTEYDGFMPPTFSDDGDYTVEYRSADVAGNVEDAKSVEFSIETDDEVAEIELTALPELRRVNKNRRQVQYRARAINVGDAPSGEVEVCAIVPAAKLNVVGPNCRTIDDIPDGQRTVEVFQFRIKPAAKGKLTRIRFLVRGEGIENQRDSARLIVRG